MRYLTVQLIAFIAGTLSALISKSYINWLPEGIYWGGLGFMLIPALIFSFKDKKLFACICLFSLFFFLNLLTAKEYIGHVPVIYLILVMISAPLRQMAVGIFSGLICAYNLGLILYHQSYNIVLTDAEMFINNLLFVGLLLISVKGCSHEAQEDSKPTFSQDYKKAA